jgi:hypothetical protein
MVSFNLAACGLQGERIGGGEHSKAMKAHELSGIRLYRTLDAQLFGSL